jgi:enoyl-CoA hydratase/carnithine racemase
MNALRLATTHHCRRRSVAAAAAPWTTTKKATGLRSFASLKASYDNILIENPTENVTVIKLHRPKALNALNDALFQDLFHATTALNNDENGEYSNVRCLILTGSAKAFAAGADISEMKTRTFEEVYRADMFAEWQQLSKLHRLPLIAAVSGFCLGGGCEVAMMCDMMLCDETAKFGQPEINLGVIPGAGGTQRLTRAIGKSKSMYMNLTGDYFMSADEAYRSGLVAKVYKDNDELMEESVKVAMKIASKGRLAVQAVKEAVNAADELSLQEGLRLERRLFHGMFATDDQKEGMAAFLEKRAPEFR